MSSRVLTVCLMTIMTNYGFEMVIPLYITGCREKIYSESAVVMKRHRLIRAIYFLTTDGDIKGLSLSQPSIFPLVKEI